jgi:imidazole glycerol-phosphate synthase subunit HisH
MIDNNRVAIIDYELCNLFSVVNACRYVGLEPVITSDHNEIMSCGGAILPGVGAFGEAMVQIRQKELDKTIYAFVKSKKPFMGICLGLQLLFDSSNEFGDFEGLGIIPGKVKKIPASSGKVPHIGWNSIELSKSSHSHEFANTMVQNEFMYFIHSYYVEPENNHDILTYTNYGEFRYCSSICRDNVSAFQFHPEKSGEAGIRIYKKFKKSINTENKR